MSNAFTSTELLANLKRRGLIPTAASAFAASDFYKVVDDETQTYIVPTLLSVHEEYLVTYDDISVDSSATSYNIPERAVGSKLRQITMADGNGGYRPLTRLEPETVSDFNAVSGPTNCYYIRGNQFVLVGVGVTGTIRLSYFQRPNRVVATTAVGEITAINTTTGVITVSSTVPSTFTTSVTYDLVKGKPGFDTLAKDLVASVVGGSSVTLTASSLPSGLAVGDFVCLSQETPIAQIPVEMHPLLAQRVTATVLQALGDEKAKDSYKVAADMEQRVLRLVSNRTEGSSRYIVNRYGVGKRGRTYFRGR